MKKQILSLCTLGFTIILSQNLHAQSGWSTNSPTGILTTNGNTTDVGIGTNAPDDKLSVEGDIGYKMGGGLRLFKGRSEVGLGIYSKDDWNNGGAIFLNGPGAPFDEGSITMLANGINTPNKISFKFAAVDGTTWHTRMYIDQSGNTTVGDLSPTNSADKLSVMGDIALYGEKDLVNGHINYRYLRARSADAGLIVTSNSSFNDGATIMMNGVYGGATSFDKGSMYLIANPDAGGNAGNICFSSKNGSGWNTNMIIDKDGNVNVGNGYMSIGDPSPNTSDRLTVRESLTLTAGTNDYRYLRARSADAGLIVTSNSSFNDGATIMMNGVYGGATTFDKGSMYLIANPDAGSNSGNICLATKSSSGWDTRMIVNKDGDVSVTDGNMTIGETSPNSTDKLTVRESLTLSGGSSDYRHLRARAAGAGLIISSNSSWNDGASIFMNGSNGGATTFDKGSMYLIANPDAGGNSGNICLATKSNSGWDTRMVVDKNGKVTIGNVSSATTYGYKLYVESGILTERVRVAIKGSAEWADYVFADNYDLKPLNEVEDFINENKHLPDVPSAEDVVKNGVDVGKMDATLLQKIEELTLYVIDLQKQIKTQQNELKQLKEGK